MVKSSNDGQDVHGHSKVTGTGAAGGMGWLPWLIGAALLLGLLILLLKGCDTTDNKTVVAPVETTAVAPAVTTRDYNRNDFETYLAGNEPVGRVFGFDNITFASGSAKLDAKASSQIDEVAEIIKGRPGTRLAVRGFADPSGDAASNLTLSKNRADAVTAALMKAGATGAQVSVAGEGETGSTATRENRRVEMVVNAR